MVWRHGEMGAHRSCLQPPEEASPPEVLVSCCQLQSGENIWVVFSVLFVTAPNLLAVPWKPLVPGLHKEERTLW